MKKRLLGLFITALLVVALTTVAWAEEPDWTEATKVSDIVTITADGIYYLNANITGNLTIPEDATVNLNLNGYTLDASTDGTNSTSPVITISDGGTLNLYNTQVDNTDFDYGTTGGTITGGSYGVSLSGGSSYTGTFNMYGGTISGNTSYGVSVSGSGATFTMENGTISGNLSNSGVSISSGAFTMNGGIISGNTRNGDGGGVYVGGGTFTMTNGTISGNTATDGGGVYISGGTFTMSGGTIGGNEAAKGGGGVYVYGGTFNISGAPEITGNTVDGSANNVYLDDGNSMTIDGEGLSTGADIGVTVETFSENITVATGANDTYLIYFSSDSALYETDFNETDSIVLKEATLFEGSGTEAIPYQIATLEDLNTLATLVNNNNTSYNDSTVYYKLTADVTITGDYTPIGKVVKMSDSYVLSNTTYFEGVFDGNDKTITLDSDIDFQTEAKYIQNGSSRTVTDYYQAVFGAVSGTVTNLNVKADGINVGRYSAGVAVYLTEGGTVSYCETSGSLSSDDNCIAGIVAINKGDVTNCTNNATLSGFESIAGIAAVMCGGSIKDCTNTGTITGENFNIGGIAGIAPVASTNTIENCTNSGTIKGVSDVGGITGFCNYITIKNCSNTGTITATGVEDTSSAGGISGSGHGTIESCTNSGTVEGVMNVGGIIGNGSRDSGNAVTVTACANTGAVSGTTNVGGVVGYLNYTGTLSSSYNMGTVSGTTNVGGVVGTTVTYGSETSSDNVSDCYYLAGIATVGVGANTDTTDGASDSTTNTTENAGTASKSIADMTNGSVIKDSVTFLTVDTLIVTSDATLYTYYEGYTFDPDGLELELTLSNGASLAVTYSADNNADDFTFTPGLTTPLATTDTVVTITCAGKTVTQSITVSEVVITSIAVETVPDQVSYSSGSKFDPTGLVISYVQNDGVTGTVTYSDNAGAFTFSPDLETALTTSDTAVTITYADCTTTQAVTVTASGGNYTPSTSSSSSTSSATSTDTTTNDDGSVSASVTVSTSTSGSTVTATVTDSNVDTAIENAVEAADGDTAMVEIDVTTKSSTDTVNATLSTDAITAIADSDVAALTVTSNLGSVSIPSDALAEIADQASGDDITITLELVDSSVLTQTQQTAVGNAQVYDLHITSDDEKIQSFGGYELTVSLPYELAEGESAEHIVVWYLGDDGTMEALEGSYDADLGMATFATPHFSYYTALHFSNNFADVSVEDYFFSPVMWAVENGITNGTTDTTFSPDATCTRAQAVTLLWKAYGSPVVNFINPFTDVSAEDYYYEAVLWAMSEGITSGTSDTTFSPNADCTRGQIVTFLYRAAGELETASSSDFTDVDADSYCYDAVLWAVENGITNGISDTNFSPNNLCNRGQIVTFLYRNLAE